jgi:hypothetical protein
MEIVRFYTWNSIISIIKYLFITKINNKRDFIE